MKKCREINKKLREPLRGKIEQGKEDFLCRWCKKPVPKKRRTFCSDECVHQHKLRSSIDHMRREVFIRDKGICKFCNLDCEALKAEAISILDTKGIEKAADFLDSHSIPINRIKGLLNRKQSLWDADHIIPVTRGGGGCDVDGMRTLCVVCHFKLSKMQRKEREIGFVGNLLWDE